MAARKDFGQQQGRPAASRAPAPRREQPSTAARSGASRSGATRQAAPEPPKPLVADNTDNSRSAPARQRQSVSVRLSSMTALLTPIQALFTRASLASKPSPTRRPSDQPEPAIPAASQPAAHSGSIKSPGSAKSSGNVKSPGSTQSFSHAQPDIPVPLTAESRAVETDSTDHLPQGLTAEASHHRTTPGSGTATGHSASRSRRTADSTDRTAAPSAGKGLSQRQLLIAVGLIGGLGMLLTLLLKTAGGRDSSSTVSIPATPAAAASESQASVTETSTTQAQATKEEEKKEEIKLPPEKTGPARFSFYEMLPETEIKPEPVEAYKSTPKDAKMKYNYLLQAGSFRKQSDAERMRARLVMEGMPNATTTRTTGSNGVWYRVRIGPFDNRSRMNRAHDKLVRMQVQPMEIKIKQ